MPELPEVEVVRKQLLPAFVGKTIVNVLAGAASYFFVTPPGTLKKRLLGRKVVALTRHGKYLFASFDDGSRLLFHLGMTGQVTARALPLDAHVHLRLGLDNGKTITFRDVRKFGKVEWVPAGKRSTREEALGPDALTIGAAAFCLALEHRRVAIKSALLDQGVLAGVGNIYADEALYRAKILPTRPAQSLSRTEATKVLGEVQKILAESVLRGGSTINDYIQPDGELGGYQNFHKVYGRTDEPCPRCRSRILRVVLGGRSTHYCENCQK